MVSLQSGFGGLGNPTGAVMLLFEFPGGRWRGASCACSRACVSFAGFVLFAHFLIGLFGFLLLHFESSLHILDRKPLLYVSFADIFSRSAACLYSLHRVFQVSHFLEVQCIDFFFFYLLWTVYIMYKKFSLVLGFKNFLLCFLSFLRFYF